jgi:hypothetical protein
MTSSQNSQKTPIATALEQWGQRKVRGVLSTMGQSLPATVVSRTGGIVTVKFALTSPYTLPNVTVPIVGSEYVRLPIQAGCPGFCMTADAYLGGMSGLGGGVADIVPRGNLSMLVWTPIGNKNWQAANDDNALCLYGPDGVVISDKAANFSWNLKTTEQIINLPTGVSLVINGNVVVNGSQEITGGLALGGNITAQDGHSVYSGNIQTSGDVTGGVGTADQVDLLSHTHKYNNPDGASTVEETEAPTAGT